MSQYARNGFTQTSQQRFKKREGFRLVFIERIALCIGPQRNALAQMIQLQQVILPRLIQKLEQQTFFGRAHNFRPEVRRLLGHFTGRGRLDALKNFGISNAFFPRPVFNRQIKSG